MKHRIVAGLAGLLLGLIGSAALVSAAPYTGQAVVRPSLIPNATPNRIHSGGPFIPQTQAVDLAKSIVGSKTAVGRTEVQLLNYADIIAWQKGATTYTIDPLREVYLVVVSAPYEPTHGQVYPGSTPRSCGWYALVVDATDGTKLQLTCGDGLWPTTLPASFGH